jgi:small subunit ribosomal protein S16
VAVRLRLTRVGGKKDPMWRVVVADQRSPRDGRVIETIGHYNAQTNPSTIVIDEERARSWLARGRSRRTRCASCCAFKASRLGAPSAPRSGHEATMSSDTPSKLLEYLAQGLVDEPEEVTRSNSSRRTMARSCWSYAWPRATTAR